jgi:hypothetical protein
MVDYLQLLAAADCPAGLEAIFVTGHLYSGKMQRITRGKKKERYMVNTKLSGPPGTSGATSLGGLSRGSVDYLTVLYPRFTKEIFECIDNQTDMLLHDDCDMVVVTRDQWWRGLRTFRSEVDILIRSILGQVYDRPAKNHIITAAGASKFVFTILQRSFLASDPSLLLRDFQGEWDRLVMQPSKYRIDFESFGPCLS